MIIIKLIKKIIFNLKSQSQKHKLITITKNIKITIIIVIKNRTKKLISLIIYNKIVIIKLMIYLI